MRQLFSLFATYNAEMNQRHFHAAEQLSEAELVQERGAFFGSILGTMNHLIVADTLWLQRFMHHPSAFACLQVLKDVPEPTSLKSMLYPDLTRWFERRCELDQLIIELTQAISSSDLERHLHYVQTNGTPSCKRFQDILQHFFNHQTHHRGQLSTLFFQAGVDVGVTDLLSLVPNID